MGFDPDKIYILGNHVSKTANALLVHSLGPHFMAADEAIKTATWRLIYVYPLLDKKAAMCEMLNAIFTGKSTNLFKMFWLQKFWLAKISDGESSLNSDERIWRFFTKCQKEVMALFGVIFNYSSPSFTLRALERHYNCISRSQVCAIFPTNRTNGDRSFSVFNIAAWFDILFALITRIDFFSRNDETTVMEMDTDWRRNKSKGVFGDFVSGTQKALLDISRAIPTSDDNFATIQESCTLFGDNSLEETVQLLTTFISDDAEVNELVKEKLSKLQDFISTHAIHIILAGFRTVAAPGKWEFDIFACNLSEFQKFCHPRFMACAMKLAVCAFFSETPVPLQSDKVRELLKGPLQSTGNASTTSKSSSKKSSGASSGGLQPVGKGPQIVHLEELAKKHCDLVC